MEFHNIDFFVGEDNSSCEPVVKLHSDFTNKLFWPFTLNIKPKKDLTGGITIYLKNESQLIQFVNSVKSSYNKYRKDQGYDR